MSLTVADIGTAAKQAVSQGVFAAINGIQRERRPVNRVAAIAATFLLICREHSLDPARALECTDNMLYDQERHTRPEFAAAAEYVRGEL